MEDHILNHILDPSRIKYFYTSGDKKTEKSSEENSKKFIDEEGRYFKEICKELTKDMEDLGLSVNFSSKILIRKVALNIILLKKIIVQNSGTTLVRDVPKKIIPLSNGRSITHTPTYHDIDLHPFFEKSIFKFQKEIDKGLEKLGLLPLQQIERQKLTILKKLKRKYANFEEEEIVKGELETSKIKTKRSKELLNQH